ncbi:MAG: hypothetical protein ABW189_05310 [Rickettsiales bacterium]
MDYLIQEARREIRRDEQNALLKKCLPYAGAITLLACAAVVAVLSSDVYYTSLQEKLSERYHSALRDLASPSSEKGREELNQLAKADDPTFSQMARIALASVEKPASVDVDEKQDKEYDVLENVLRAANGTKEPEELYAFRRLIDGYVRLKNVKTPQDAEKLAGECDENVASDLVFSYSWKEMKAYALLMANKPKESQAAFSAMSIDQNAPESVKMRSEEMSAIISENAVTPYFSVKAQ